MKVTNTLMGLAFLIGNSAAQASSVPNSEMIEAQQQIIQSTAPASRLPEGLEMILQNVKASGLDKIIADSSPSEGCCGGNKKS